MARHEADREDLLREATALGQRIEFEAFDGERIVAGFRSDGSGSIFFGVEPVYQFNRLGELRRAFLNGVLVKAEAGGLVTLRRRRVEHEVQLIRHELPPGAAAELLREAEGILRRFLEQVQTRTIQIVGQVPLDASVDQRVEKWLSDLLRRPLVVAASAGLRGA